MREMRAELDLAILEQQRMTAELARVVNAAYDLEQKGLLPEWKAVAINAVVDELWGIWNEHALNLWVLAEGVTRDGKGMIMGIEATAHLYGRLLAEQKPETDQMLRQFPNAKMGQH